MKGKMELCMRLRLPELARMRDFQLWFTKEVKGHREASWANPEHFEQVPQNGCTHDWFFFGSTADWSWVPEGLPDEALDLIMTSMRETRPNWEGLVWIVFT